MSLPPEKNLAAEENIKEINSRETGTKKKNLLKISILALIGIIVLSFIIIQFNNDQSKFRDVTQDLKQTLIENKMGIENENVKVLAAIERKKPKTSILFVYDKNYKMYTAIVFNDSNEPIKFNSADLRILWSTDVSSPISPKANTVIAPGYSIKLDTDINTTTGVKAIMYYPSDNPKTGVTVDIQ
ncbi:hypothetical protein [Neomoorella thermoacetica]|uniref:hypothetical protein n=1 Tax=Neomoorella thermoacetica TaxID=1525 RepID=UPI0008FB0632|nr:hypothetical protein [Moorella thermoacetica]APC07619.1 hypothetical protein MTJW_04450 [Moorella thermoacetica]OIQ53748.1 hypothetical protein MORE_17200 [Moorella thermoacetica]